jgi:hypothetical protein
MKKFVFAILFLPLLFSCEKSEDYNEIPEIKFRSFEVIPGDGDYTISEGILTFDFVDGDGNIGFAENSDLDSANNLYTANDIVDFVYKEYYKQDGIFIEKEGNPFYLPYFKEGVYRKSLKGKIDIYFPRTILSPDTVYYEFYILDRDMNQSNIETTPEIIYSELLKQY